MSAWSTVESSVLRPVGATVTKTNNPGFRLVRMRDDWCTAGDVVKWCDHFGGLAVT